MVSSEVAERYVKADVGVSIVPKSILARFRGRPGLERALKNIGWLFIDRMVRVLVGVFVTVLIARYLGPNDFGVLSYALALTALCGAMALLGMKEVVIRDLVKDPQMAGRTLGSAGGLMMIGSSASYVLLVSLVLLTRSDDAIAKLASFVIGASVLFRFLEFGAFWFESQVQSKYVVLAQLGVFLLASAAKVYLVAIDAPLVAFVVTVTIQAITSSTAAAIVFARFKPDSVSLSFELRRAKQLVAESWPLLLAGIAMMVYTRIDQLMIASILGDESVGIYTAAITVSEATYVLAVIVVATTFPAVLSAKKEGEAVYHARFQQLFDLIVILAVAVAVPLTLLSGWITNTLFGKSYEAAGIVLTVHIWSLVFVFLGVVSGRWFVAENRQKLNLQRTILGALINIVLNLVLIPRYGLIGAAVASVIAHSIAAFFSDLFNAKTRSLFRMKLAALFVPRAVLRLVRNF